MRARGALVPAVLFAGALVPGPVSAARAWVEVRSPSFTVITDGSEKDGREVAAKFEAIRAFLKARWPWARFEPQRPVTILAVRNERGLKELLPGLWEQQGRARPAGTFLRAPDRNWVALRMDLARRELAENEGLNPYLIHFHEYVHLVLRLNFGELPPWFNEGLAEFWGNTIIRDRRVDEGRPMVHHVQLLRSRSPIPLAELFSVRRGSNRYSEENRATIFYAQSWALVHFLVLGSEERQGQINRFATLLRQGVPSSQAASEAFGSLAALDEELQKHVLAVGFRYRRHDQGLEVDEAAFASRPLPGAESLGIRAAFHVATGREAEARALAAEALELDAGSAQAHEALALLAWRKGETDVARDALGRALQRPDASSHAHYLYGRVRLQSFDGDEDLAAVEASFRRATELSPAFAEAYVALALVKADRGAPLAETLPLAVKAALLDPGEIRHSITALRLAASAGELPEARAQAERLLANATSDDDRAMVAALLRDLSRREKAGSDPAAAAGFQCEHGNAEACAEMATRFRDGADAERDPVQAATYFERACSGGHVSSCAALGWALEQGDGVSQDLPRAVSLYERACPGGDAWSCRRLAFALANAQGIAADPARAAGLLERLCGEGDLEACARFGAMLRLGQGTPKDDQRAESLLDDACAKGSAWACGELGFLYAARSTPENLLRAVDQFEMACEGGSAGSCAMLAALTQTGQGVERDPGRAQALYRKACEGGYGDACSHVEGGVK